MHTVASPGLLGEVVSEGHVLIDLVTACEKLGFQPEQMLRQSWAEALARQFADGRRELAVRVPSWLLDDEATQP
jgi:hypothetical protein